MKTFLSFFLMVVFTSCTMPADNPANSAESPENTGASMPETDTSAYSKPPSGSENLTVDSAANTPVPQR